MESGMSKLEGAAFAPAISRRALAMHVFSSRGQGRIKQRWNPPDLDARTVEPRLM
jgi:hypothetical protein